jgi:hypothetical protein
MDKWRCKETDAVGGCDCRALFFNFVAARNCPNITLIMQPKTTGTPIFFVVVFLAIAVSPCAAQSLESTIEAERKIAPTDGSSFHERTVDIDRGFGRLAPGAVYKMGLSGDGGKSPGGSEELIPFYFDGKYILP